MDLLLRPGCMVRKRYRPEARLAGRRTDSGTRFLRLEMVGGPDGAVAASHTPAGWPQCWSGGSQ